MNNNLLGTIFYALAMTMILTWATIGFGIYITVSFEVAVRVLVGTFFLCVLGFATGRYYADYLVQSDKKRISDKKEV